MTTAQSRVVAISVSYMVAATLLSGCNATPTTYRIDGADSAFCVPHAVDVTPARAGQGDHVKGGFAMNGCWQSNKNVCKGPENLVSLAVVAKSSFTGRRLGDFSSDAYVREVAVKQWAKAKPLASNLMAVPDGLDSKKWFVWRVVGQNQNSVSNDVELMTTCAAKNGASSYFCDRWIAGPDFSVTYSFFEDSNLPTSFELLDRQVIGSVESLRCR